MLNLQNARQQVYVHIAATTVPALLRIHSRLYWLGCAR